MVEVEVEVEDTGVAVITTEITADEAVGMVVPEEVVVVVMETEVMVSNLIDLKRPLY